MTDEEAERPSEKRARNPPRPGHDGTGYFAQRKKNAHAITIDGVAAHYLNAKAIADHKTPAQIVGEMVQERIADESQRRGDNAPEAKPARFQARRRRAQSVGKPPSGARAFFQSARRGLSGRA